MCCTSSRLVKLVLTSISTTALVATIATGADKISEPPPGAFATPISVFNVCRQAEAAANWRCYTPERQDQELFEAVVACETTAKYQEALAIRRKYGADDAEINKAYQKLETAERRRTETVTPGSTTVETLPGKNANATAAPRTNGAARSTYEISVAAVAEVVRDKAAFFSEVNTLTNSQSTPSLGDLKVLKVFSEAASGRAVSTIVNQELVAGKPPKAARVSIEKSISFRRINGRWLIDIDRSP